MKLNHRLRNIALNLVLLLFIFNLMLATLEGLLRLGVFDDNSVWVAPKHYLDDELTDTMNYIFQARHSLLKFNDRFRSPQKPPHIKYRIGILGDSFLQGTSIPYDSVWSHQLEFLLKEQFPEVEVLTFGRSGWPTVTEFAYLEQEGIKYGLDMAIFGFVTNDLQLNWGDAHPTYPKDEKNVPLLKKINDAFFDALAWFFGLWENIFPYTDLFLQSAIRNSKGNLGNLITQTDEIKADDSNIYFTEPTYLVPYDNLLKSIKNFEQEKSIPILFVLTPNNYHPIFRHQYDLIIPYFEKNGIAYLDTYPAVKQKLGHLSYRALGANPTDGHPGSAVNRVYAEQVYEWLKPQLLAKGLGKKD